MAPGAAAHRGGVRVDVEARTAGAAGRQQCHAADQRPVAPPESDISPRPDLVVRFGAPRGGELLDAPPHAEAAVMIARHDEERPAPIVCGGYGVRGIAELNRR